MIKQGIYAAGDAAIGLGSLRKGFGLTPEDDRLFALGWPHLVYLVPGDATEKELANGKTFSAAHAFDSGEIPAAAAPRMLRHLFSMHKAPKQWLAAIRNPAPLSDAELERFAGEAITEQFGKVVVFLLEALRSSAWALDRVVTAYEESTISRWKTSTELDAFGDGAFRALHFVLLRVTKTQAAAARKRLTAIAKKLGANKINEWHRAYELLRLLLNPKLSKSTIYNLSLRAPAQSKYVRDTAVKYLSKMERGDTADPDARLAFLGGDDVTQAYADHANELTKDQRDALVTQFARVRHPSIADLMRTVNNRAAKKWLAANDV